ncbi:MAG: PAS domain S-box protein [Steroidobacteraceae bacterium]
MPSQMASQHIAGAAGPLPDLEFQTTPCSFNFADTPPAETFDRITRLVAIVLDVPVVLISLLDRTTLRVKSRFGREMTDWSWEDSFCAEPAFHRQSVIVCDAVREARFASMPLVHEAPRIGAYLGVSLCLRDGRLIGTLGAIDGRPRAFIETDLKKLSDCAKIIEEALHAHAQEVRTRRHAHFAVERERLFRDTFEQASVGITHTSLSGALLRINQRACDMLGYTAAELHNTSFIDITHPDDIAKNMEAFQKMLAGGGDSYRIEKRFLRKDGSYLWTDLSVALRRSADGRPDCMIAVIEDIAARKQLEAELVCARDSLSSQVAEQTIRLTGVNQALRIQVKAALESERQLRNARDRLRALTDHIPALIGYWNRDLRCEFANETHRDWYGHDPQALVGMSMRDCWGEPFFQRSGSYIGEALEGRSQWFETHLTKPDGAAMVIEVRYIPNVGDDDEVTGLYMLATDITQSRKTQRALEAANAKLTHDSVTDYLTGLSNRRTFSERSDQAWSRFQSHGEGYGLIVMDLDNFKRINDGYGHNVGDDVLRIVGNLLQAELRDPRDVAARMGGEEFAVLFFGDLDAELLSRIAERIRGRINQESIAVGRETLQFTSSFGAAIARPVDDDSKKVYARADAALYEAKAAGKNCVVFGKAISYGSTGKFRDLRRLSASGG